jgi:hypothetical protein
MLAVPIAQAELPVSILTQIPIIAAAAVLSVEIMDRVFKKAAAQPHLVLMGFQVLPVRIFQQTPVIAAAAG